MKYPIIVIADQVDISFYHSAEIAARSLEAIDVLDGLYEVYDANACLLDIKICPREVKRWFGFGEPEYIMDMVKIEDPQSINIYYDKLIEILKKFYSYLPIGIKDDSTLSDLIDIAKERNLIDFK